MLGLCPAPPGDGYTGAPHPRPGRPIPSTVGPGVTGGPDTSRGPSGVFDGPQVWTTRRPLYEPVPVLLGPRLEVGPSWSRSTWDSHPPPLPTTRRPFPFPGVASVGRGSYCVGSSVGSSTEWTRSPWKVGRGVCSKVIPLVVGAPPVESWEGTPVHVPQGLTDDLPREVQDELGRHLSSPLTPYSPVPRTRSSVSSERPEAVGDVSPAPLDGWDSKDEQGSIPEGVEACGNEKGVPVENRLGKGGG